MTKKMFKRALLFLPIVALLLTTSLFAKPKTKLFNNTPDEVFQAALRTARERHVVTFVDEKNQIFTFETGVSALSYGFVANASIESEPNNQTKLIINVQQKKPIYSFNAGDRMADKFFDQVQEELADASSQRTAEKPDAPHVDVSPVPNTQEKEDASDRGTVFVKSNPDGCDVSVDGSFVGNTPAVLKLSPGKHTINVAGNGYQAWSKDISVMAGSEVKLIATLMK